MKVLDGKATIEIGGVTITAKVTALFYPTKRKNVFGSIEVTDDRSRDLLHRSHRKGKSIARIIVQPRGMKTLQLRKCNFVDDPVNDRFNFEGNGKLE